MKTSTLADETEFVVRRLRSGPGPLRRVTAFKADDALLICVLLAPTAVGQWRARCNGQEVGVTQLALDDFAQLLGEHVLHRYCGATTVTMTPRRGLQTWQELRAEELLRAKVDGNITLPEIAAACSLSVRHFSRGFRKSFGISARQFLIRLRLERAKILLARTQKPLAEIAHLCGFCDQPAFTRAFCRVERMTPSRWRAAHGQPADADSGQPTAMP